MISHDHNFKNVVLDFPVESLSWFLPEALECMGKLENFEFIRQEPGKRKLQDGHLALDMPILFRFEKGDLILWLLEFQEDKARFSIHRLLHYTADYMESYPKARIIPTVLFTDRRKWRKDVDRFLESRLGSRTFVHFEYQMIRLFDYQARDYYNYENPVAKIFLPKMSYAPEERGMVIRRAWQGLYELVSASLFDKYVDFIDIYAAVQEEEREALLREITEQEETHMLAEYIREKGRTEGMAQGMAQGRTQGMTEGICKEKFQTILNLRKFNMQPADIAQITRLTPEKVEAVLAAGDGGLDLLIREKGV
ncbi:hypothetical protein [Desulfobotulus sp.]|jgi:hypothetical protein|uniref:hypothetical protein n=1 Tax=Desulfobotulus sp. TaxID=1940337 RepID=UPI002A35BF34|nr:hypothetical protein [Desulfobotulus sp.]MDY0163066.1 hypothetical protein [Desulfobotulus sp.]